jgi:hypothetical protein
LLGIGGVPSRTLEKAARSAAEHCDAPCLAFVAAHTSNGPEALRLADQAVGLDPRLTWIYVPIYYKLYGNDPERRAARQRLIERLEAWDHDNAVPYLLEALESRGPNFPAWFALDRLAKETVWCQAMAKAFRAPRYDSYAKRWFELNRAWLREHGMAKPTALFFSLAAAPIGFEGYVRTYADVLTKELGKKAEETGRPDEALGYYWQVAHMGERLHAQAAGASGQWEGAELQIQAYERLVPLLRRAGRTDEAASLGYILAQLRAQREVWRGNDPLAQSSIYQWAGLLTELFAGLVMLFILLILLATLFRLAERWVRPERQGPLFRLAAASRPYLPVLLFLACLGFYLSYYPFATNFRHSMAASGEIHNLDALFENILPGMALWPGNWGTPLGSPFRPYIWYALSGLALALLATLLLRRRASQ